MAYLRSHHITRGAVLEVPEQYSRPPRGRRWSGGREGSSPSCEGRTTQAPGLTLGVWRGAVGYKVGEERRVLNVRTVNLDLTLKAT